MKKTFSTIFLVTLAILTMAQPANVDRKDLKKLAGALTGEFNNNEHVCGAVEAWGRGIIKSVDL